MTILERIVCLLRVLLAGAFRGCAGAPNGGPNAFGSQFELSGAKLAKYMDEDVNTAREYIKRK
jgi:hypothetical protein